MNVKTRDETKVVMVTGHGFLSYWSGRWVWWCKWDGVSRWVQTCRGCIGDMSEPASAMVHGGHEGPSPYTQKANP
jgi:hypothetical protein